MISFTDKAPGVYRIDVFPTAAEGLRTGVPAFLGLAERDTPASAPQLLTLWPEFERFFGRALPNGYLADSVRGFFENGGRACYVLALDGGKAGVEQPIPERERELAAGLEKLAALDMVDLVSAPDIVQARRLGQVGSAPPELEDVRRLQNIVLEHCNKQGDRFAILDAVPGVTMEHVREQRTGLSGSNGALYYPAVRPADGDVRLVPPCGYVAGIYARSDERVGVHKAPANEVVRGVLDLEARLGAAEQATLNSEGINCLRAFPGRGIRVWGARTLATEAAWRYVAVRRLVLTVGRWIERYMAAVVWEPNEPGLWARITRELTSYLDGLFERGALKGATPDEAYYVRCDRSTNPPEVRDSGTLVAEIGLAPAVPREFVAIRIVHGTSGVSIST